MAKSKRNLGVGLSVDKGQFVKSCGYHKSAKGNIAATRHYLGPVQDGEDAALEKFIAVRRAWNEKRGVVQIDHGGKMIAVWAESPSAAAERASVDLGASAAGPADAARLSPQTSVRDAAQRFIDSIERRWKLGNVSHAHWAGSDYCLKRALEFMADKPLAQIGAADLSACVGAIGARPTTKPRKEQTDVPGRISVKTAKVWLATLRDFLDEMSKTETAPGSETPVWVKPLRFDDIFRQNAPKLTQSELNQTIIDGETEADFFTVDEFRKLYKRASANDAHRAWIMLALNCGFAQMEIATLTCNQIVGLDSDAAKIRRHRGKTGIYAEWPIWSHTADLLRYCVGKRKGDDLAVVTEKGKPLIEPRGMGRRDAVMSEWNNIRTVLPEGRRLSFKYLRKTGANIIRKMSIGGDAVAEMYLSHADNKSGVLSAYSGRDWAKLAAALTELHRILFDGWDFKIPKVKQSMDYIKARAHGVATTAEPTPLPTVPAMILAPVPGSL
jgi:integrase